MRRAALALVTLAACAPALPLPQPLDLRAALETAPQPAVTADGACWGADTVPAVIETETVQIMAPPEDRPADSSEDGTLPGPAVFRTQVRHQIVAERQDVWFRVPCAADLTLPFVATLQRALKARGYFPGAVTGSYDAATAAAVRRFQAARGLDSAVLTLATAQALGVAITPLS